MIMKINKNDTVSLDQITYALISDNQMHLYIETTSRSCYEYYDSSEGEGFAKRTKAKIDAYLEAKEGLVLANFKLHQERERVKHTAQCEHKIECEVKK